jgi:hypothetical protein
MGWFNDYDRMYGSYDRTYSGSWYGPEGGNRHRNDRWGTEGGWGRGRSPYAGRGGYSYEYEYRTPPDQSPTYGRQGDQEVQRWAQRHGYDSGFQISPNQGQNQGRWGRQGNDQGSMGRPGGQGSWGSGRGNWNRSNQWGGSGGQDRERWGGAQDRDRWGGGQDRDRWGGGQDRDRWGGGQDRDRWGGWNSRW